MAGMVEEPGVGEAAFEDGLAGAPQVDTSK